MSFVWKILEIYAKDGVISDAKYLCSVSDGQYTVETEGNWHFPEAGTVPFEQVTEEMVAQWIEEASMRDGKSIIKSRLEEQLANMEKKPVPAPWQPQIFKPEV